MHGAAKTSETTTTARIRYTTAERGLKLQGRQSFHCICFLTRRAYRSDNGCKMVFLAQQDIPGLNSMGAYPSKIDIYLYILLIMAMAVIASRASAALSLVRSPTNTLVL